MRQDIAQGSMALLDPHGDLAENIVGVLPDCRKEDLVSFNTPDPDQPYGYNPLKRVVKAKRPLAASVTGAEAYFRGESVGAQPSPADPAPPTPSSEEIERLRSHRTRETVQLFRRRVPHRSMRQGSDVEG
jgi:hypothetical protein